MKRRIHLGCSVKVETTVDRIWAYSNGVCNGSEAEIRNISNYRTDDIGMLHELKTEKY